MRGVNAYRAFGAANLGLIALLNPTRDSMIVDKGPIMEIVRPGIGGLRPPVVAT